MDGKITILEHELIIDVVELMDKIGIPKWHEVHREDLTYFSRFPFLNQEYIVQQDIYPLLLNGPKKERGHNMRVAILGSDIADFLGFEKESEGSLLKFLVDIAHDRGKVGLSHLYPENTNGCVRRLEQLKNQHIDAHNLPMDYGKTVASSIERTHLYQPKPYPAKPFFRRTQENEFLSKLTALGDCWDSLLFRIGTDAKSNLDFAINRIVEVYGSLRIKYEGKKFPRINTTGEDLIRNLINNGILLKLE